VISTQVVTSHPQAEAEEGAGEEEEEATETTLRGENRSFKRVLFYNLSF
jgi:hypothetical protein